LERSMFCAIEHREENKIADTNTILQIAFIVRFNV
jgi:hypothetical protein